MKRNNLRGEITPEQHLKEYSMVTVKPVHEISCVCQIPGNARILETKIFYTRSLEDVGLTLIGQLR